ncbi:MAG: DUF3592 domain-containing protein [Boseongicola sp.]
MNDYLAELFAGDQSAIILAAAVYCGVFGAWSVVYCFLVRRWPSTIGTLNEAGLTQFGWSTIPSGQDYRSDVQYTYEVDDQTFQGKRLSPTFIVTSLNARALLRWQMKGIERVGENGVRVYFKPTNPQKSYLIVPSNQTITLLAVIVFGGALLLFSAI